MSRADLSRDPCTVARAVELVGEPWTLMVLRELFLGTRRFDDFQRLTGASPHLLSRRLRRLEAEGVVTRRAYSQRPLRHEYRLTEKGRDLWPVIVALKAWGDRWAEPQGEPPMQLRHKGCGARMIPRMVCPECGEPMEARDSAVEVSDDWARARAAKRGARGAEARSQGRTA